MLLRQALRTGDILVLAAAEVAFSARPDARQLFSYHQQELEKRTYMGVRITLMIMRLVVLAALVLGLTFWIHPAAETEITLSIHRTLGILTVLLLWVLGFFVLRVKGGLVLGIAAFVWGLLVVFVGLNQTAWLVGAAHWVVQVVHLLLGVSAMGFGEMIAGRYKRATAAAPKAA